MSLFSPKKEKQRSDALTSSITAPHGSTVMGRKVAFLDGIGHLAHGESIHFITQGKWSSHELLSKLLEVSGPAEVRISTYSMTEDPVRMLVNYLLNASITNLKVITDKRFKTQQGAAHQLASANFPVVLMDVHAKVMVIRNEDWNITVIGSANLTKNKRAEAGVITDNEQIASFYWNWIDNAE